MFRKLTAVLALPLLLAAAAAAQQVAPKALVVIRDFDDGHRLVSAMEQALALKKAGLDVQVLFEAESVLVFVQPGRGAAPEPPPEEVLEADGVAVGTITVVPSFEADKSAPQILISSDSLADLKEGKVRKIKRKRSYRDVRKVRVGTGVQYMRAWWREEGAGGIADRTGNARAGAGSAAPAEPPWRKFAYRDQEKLAELTKELPYTICSFSAEVYGVYDDLKAAGRPLSQDSSAPVDLAPFVKGGYKIYVY